LRAHAHPGSFLASPAHNAGGSPTLIESPPERVGAQVGRYKLLQQIGEGGMGVVYLAEQLEPVRRKVALKLIKPGMDSRQIIARFEAERQALALMDHVNIARVLDAGTAESGRPYFVMELVHGVPITQYCDDNRLTTRQRLELFVPVCLAIQHAHQKGIIHRDIKPSNVMITLYDGKPVPKVIDFGVAKATQQQLSEQTLFTQYGTLVGTLEYMSPEQAEMSALGVDTRSDIYSLGVLLYELLTGSTPLDQARMRDAAYGEILRMIRELEPPRPSTRLSDSGAALASISAQRHTAPARLTSLMRGELDWIVMKTLEKDRSRRYETASGFAADVQRYLNDEPVQACPPSVRYRFGKFARRKKSALTFTALVIVVLLMFAGSVGWSVRDREARQTRLVGQVVIILDDVDRLMREQKWAEALATAKRAEPLMVGGEANAKTQDRVQQVLADLSLVQRLDEARLLESQVAGDTFDYAGAERAYADAFADAGLTIDGLTVEQAVGPLRARSRIVNEIASGLTDWSRLRRKLKQGTDDSTWQHLSAVADAIDCDPWRRRLRAAWNADETGAMTLRRLGASADVRELPSSTIVLLAGLVRQRVSPDEAAKLLFRAQEHRPGDFWISFQLASCLSSSVPKRLDEAVAFYRAALALRPENPAVLNNLGNALYNQKKLNEAVTCYRKAIDLNPKAAFAHNNLGSALKDQGKFEEAIASYRQAITSDPKYAAAHNNLGWVLKTQGKLKEAIASYHRAINSDPKYAAAHNNLGSALRDQGKFEEAIASYRTAIENDPKLPNTCNNLGVALMYQGNLDEAIAWYRKAIHVDPKHAFAHSNLGLVLEGQGKIEEAIASHRRAIESDPKSADANYAFGRTLKAQGKTEEAVASYRTAIENDPKHAKAHDGLGLTLTAQGKIEEAIASYRRAVESDPKYAAAHYNLGVALNYQGKLEEAIASYRQAIESDPNFAFAHYNLGNNLRDQGKLEQAIASYRKAIDLDPTFAPAHYNFGKVLHCQQKWDEATTCYRKAIELNPNIVEFHVNLARVLYQQQDFDEAIAVYRTAVRVKPDYVEAHLGLACVLINKGQDTEAVNALREAIRLKPHDALPYNDLGWTLAKTGNVKEAIAAYDEAIRLKPDFFLPHASLGLLLAAGPDPKYWDGKRAVELTTKAVTLGGQNGVYWKSLGAAHYRAGNWKESIAALQKSLKLSKEGHSFEWVFLAMAHWKSGNKEEARTCYDKAVERMSQHPRETAELLRVRAEAEQLMGIGEQSSEAPSPGGDSQPPEPD
jgi:eukaryotic-like serine/threonine-protein kinase